MTQQINQFIQSEVKGSLDLTINPTIFSVQVDAAQATDLVPGQLVKLATTAGGIMKVVASSAATDAHFGVVRYNIKDASFPAGAVCEIAGEGSVVYMEAGAAITRGADVMYAASVQVVTAATTGNVIVGKALDAATAAGQYIRVLLAGPYAPKVP